MHAYRSPPPPCTTPPHRNHPAPNRKPYTRQPPLQVFDHDRWAAHRSTRRYVRHALGMFKASMGMALALPPPTGPRPGYRPPGLAPNRLTLLRTFGRDMSRRQCAIACLLAFLTSLPFLLLPPAVPHGPRPGSPSALSLCDKHRHLRWAPSSRGGEGLRSLPVLLLLTRLARPRAPALRIQGCHLGCGRSTAGPVLQHSRGLRIVKLRPRGCAALPQAAHCPRPQAAGQALCSPACPNLAHPLALAPHPSSHPN